MKTVTPEQFFDPTNPAGLVDGEWVQITHPNGMSQSLQWYNEPAVIETIPWVITAREFRSRFDYFSKQRLDKLQDNIDDDATVLNLCPNITQATLNNWRDILRSLFKDLYADTEEIDLSSQAVKDGMDLLVQTGVIDQATADNVLTINPEML